MRINDLISLFIDPTPLAARRQRGVLGIDTGGTDLNSNRQGNAAFAAPVQTTGSVASSSGPSNSDGDYADLITLLASRLGASKPAFGESQQDPFANGARIVDSSTRTRAVLAYHFPQQGANGPSIDLTFSIESAYRTIDILPAGSTLDTQA